MGKAVVSTLGAFTNVHVFHKLQLDVKMFDVILYNLWQLFVLSNY